VPYLTQHPAHGKLDDGKAGIKADSRDRQRVVSRKTHELHVRVKPSKLRGVREAHESSPHFP
jgi:hypothetical protein